MGVTQKHSQGNPQLAIQRLDAGEVLGAIAQGITTLIPKVQLCQLQPITVTSTIGRLYDRILARRLERTLKIGPRQKGFISDDGAHMNVRTHGGLLAHAKTSASPLGLAFLDIRGAYDNVSQDSLQRACVRLGFPQPIRYIQTVKNKVMLWRTDCD